MVMSMAHVRAHMTRGIHITEFVEQNRFDVIDRTASRQADLVTSLRKLSTEAG